MVNEESKVSLVEEDEEVDVEKNQSVDEDKELSGVRSEELAAEADGVAGLVGRELDAAIAERVMGWTRFPEAMHPTDNRTIGGVLYCPPEYPWNGNAMNVVPYFSSDIAAAMEVVEHLFRQGYTVTVHASGIDQKYWCAVCTPKPDCMWFGSDMLDTAPEAICRAAIQATRTAAGDQPSR
jgi:hypothetical protein